MVIRILFGVVCVAFSLLWLGDLWGVVSWNWLWRQPWTGYVGPVALLYVGLHVVAKGLTHGRNLWVAHDVPPAEEGNVACCSARCGGDEYVYRGEVFRGAVVDACLGGVRLDLREAVFEGDMKVDVRTCCGGVELWVPKTVRVVVKSRSFVGGVSNEAVCGEEEARITMFVAARNVVGGVSIRC